MAGRCKEMRLTQHPHQPFFPINHVNNEQYVTSGPFRTYGGLVEQSAFSAQQQQMTTTTYSYTNQVGNNGFPSSGQAQGRGFAAPQYQAYGRNGQAGNGLNQQPAAPLTQEQYETALNDAFLEQQALFYTAAAYILLLKSSEEEKRRKAEGLAFTGRVTFGRTQWAHAVMFISLKNEGEDVEEQVEETRKGMRHGLRVSERVRDQERKKARRRRKRDEEEGYEAEREAEREVDLKY
jgi:hypothetical protein